DAWESWGGSNRFVSVAMPIFFVLFCYGLEQIARLATERIQAKAPNSLDYARYGSVAILLVALVNFNAINGPRSLWEWLLINRTLNVEPNAKYVRIGLLLREITSPRASVAVVWAGATPYFSERYAIDLLGKSDRKVAREPMHLEHFAPAERLTAFWPGHLKWNLEYSIGHLRPDVVVAWYQTIPEEMPYAGGAYAAVRIQGIDLFLLNGSENVLWDKIPQQ
ncbi:MAG TPA: hypothetical protein VER55_07295, partial [Ardenticatenaceae bacterium]|nr:hypothetical protein [Ardenticatenaceae bacterium]